uniref:Uncharacterized protein n=1 Tax=Arundo donax TaxID=35708 RepID=A0A0A9BN24_ARUDO
MADFLERYSRLLHLTLWLAWCATHVCCTSPPIRIPSDLIWLPPSCLVKSLTINGRWW